MGFCTILYHRVHPRFGIKPETFEKQIAFLKRNFNVLALQNLRFKNRYPSVLITFDDGFLDFLVYAFPVLEKFAVPCVLFVSPERVLDSSSVRNSPEDTNVSTGEAFKRSFLNGDNSPFLSWGELQHLQSTGLVSIESHALTHKAVLGKGKPYTGEKDWRIYSLPKSERERIREGTELTSVLVTNYKETEKELKMSKEIIEEKLKKRVRALSWPWGIYDETALEIAKRIGYEFCFTTERGFNGKDLCRIKRLAVGERKSMFWFKTRTLFYSL